MTPEEREEIIRDKYPKVLEYMRTEFPRRMAAIQQKRIDRALQSLNKEKKFPEQKDMY